MSLVSFISPTRRREHTAGNEQLALGFREDEVLLGGGENDLDLRDVAHFVGD